jgi:hypothetical protein
VFLDGVKRYTTGNGESLWDERFRGSYLPNPFPSHWLRGYLPGISHRHHHWGIDFA